MATAGCWCFFSAPIIIALKLLDISLLKLLDSLADHCTSGLITEERTLIIWENMHASRGEGSVLTGSSVHNQRIERFNRDLNKNCSHVHAPIFYELESLGILDTDNATYIFCLHYVFLPRINYTLEEFTAAYNNHSLSSEGNRTPVQLFALDNDLPHLHNPELPTAGSANSQRGFSPLNDRDLRELNDAINPLQNDNNNVKTLFQRTQQFIFDKLVNVWSQHYTDSRVNVAHCTFKKYTVKQILMFYFYSASWAERFEAGPLFLLILSCQPLDS